MEEPKKSSRKDDAYRLFFEAMFEGGVENIVKVASKSFESPVLLTDENYRLICQVPNKPIGNSVWDTLYHTKTLPKEVIWEYQNLFLNNQIDMYKPFYADWGMVEDAPRIFGEVFDTNQIYGHVSIFLMDKSPKEDDIEIAQIFINALKIEILRRRKEFGRWHTSVSTCLLDLLNRDASHQVLEEINKYDKLNNTMYYDTLQVFSLGMHNKDTSAKKLSIHRNTLLYRLNRSKDIFNLIYDEEKTALHLLCSFLLLEANRIL